MVVLPQSLHARGRGMQTRPMYLADLTLGQHPPASPSTIHVCFFQALLLESIASEEQQALLHKMLGSAPPPQQPKSPRTSSEMQTQILASKPCIAMGILPRRCGKVQLTSRRSSSRFHLLFPGLWNLKSVVPAGEAVQ